MPNIVLYGIGHMIIQRTYFFTLMVQNEGLNVVP